MLLVDDVDDDVLCALQSWDMMASTVGTRTLLTGHSLYRVLKSLITVYLHASSKESSRHSISTLHFHCSAIASLHYELKQF